MFLLNSARREPNTKSAKDEELDFEILLYLSALSAKYSHFLPTNDSNSLAPHNPTPTPLQTTKSVILALNLSYLCTVLYSTCCVTVDVFEKVAHTLCAAAHNNSAWVLLRCSGGPRSGPISSLFVHSVGES
jgi:hypothetical protein